MVRDRDRHDVTFSICHGVFNCFAVIDWYGHAVAFAVDKSDEHCNSVRKCEPLGDADAVGDNVAVSDDVWYPNPVRVGIPKQRCGRLVPPWKQRVRVMSTLASRGPPQSFLTTPLA